MPPRYALPLLLVGSLTAAPAIARPAAPSIETLEKIIADRDPAVRVESVDHERITAKRIDIVGDDGTIRMTLAADTPAPIIDGIQYKRAFDVSGLILYDARGSERGGFGVADLPNGSMAVLALDHPAQDAIGWRVAPDGAVSFSINQAPPPLREPALGNRLVPGVATSTRIKLDVAADGTPSVALADAEDRARVRLTVTPEGYGAIEFLNAAGEVVETLAPEAKAARK
ncbi:MULTISPECIES: hypothetical protein [Sphingopyxis]|uniref:hypothetical protein n=1 Tax=Sphingopyxis TaxID=165697 RepID=UPI00086EC87D|nr:MULTISPECIES: hypothetical protein [Sphingopyxis]APW72253.1 hypothetical protein BWD40_04685 [Sphingopyxis granuli]AVA13088.1 hypothetical protein C3E99_03830 [Sphingopyxis sp. MG]ODU30494.1 MAG: hypothetical protein ABS88_05800 [Sphingopyxis sp. SCN 67-31]QUM71937.1 hypothetical protein ICN83_16700 [Sphingopyxis granuli]